MTKIYLIRHGQTDWNREEIFRGRADRPLNEVGGWEAGALSRALADVTIDFIYSSPLIRAQDTARPIASAHGLKVIPLPGIIDIDYGDWQGLSHDQAKEQYPELYRKWQEHPEQVEFPGGESLNMVRERVMSAFKEIVTRHPEQSGVVVSHRVVNKVLLCAILGLDNSHFWEIKQDTAAFNIINCADESMAIQVMNDTCHLKSLGRDRITADF
ncbi:MAG: histidine phosphatase family protein [Deltaproteobacteria bacterium]|nr:MAG: histidine phosphatase family protein [Deltaproteobacteria bacterium]